MSALTARNANTIRRSVVWLYSIGELPDGKIDYACPLFFFPTTLSEVILFRGAIPVRVPEKFVYNALIQPFTLCAEYTDSKFAFSASSSVEQFR